MGVSNSRLEEDKGLQLCRARKKFIKQALNGRCSLAAAHIAYIEELRILGTSLRRFVQTDALVEPFVHYTRSPTPEPHSLTDRPGSQLSLSPQSLSPRVDGAANTLSSLSTPVSSQYQSHHMKFRGAFSKKVEEKPPAPVAASVSSNTIPSATPRTTEAQEASSVGSPLPPEMPPWDYFGLFHPIDNHFSGHEGREYDQGSEIPSQARHLTAEEGVPETDDRRESFTSHGIEESQVSEDEFDEPSSANLVRRFENVNRSTENVVNGGSPLVSSGSRVLNAKFPTEDSTGSRVPDTKFSTTENSNEAEENLVNSHSPIMSFEDRMAEAKFVDEKKNASPVLSPMRATSSRFLHFEEVKITPMDKAEVEDKAVPKDFISSMKDIEQLFIKTSDSGKEVPRMLEANKFHFRPVNPGRDRGSFTTSILKSCFSCGQDPSEVPQETPQNSVKYLTWHRTTSSRSGSSQNLLDSNANDGVDDFSDNLFDNACMVSGSHASTLDRLYAWEKKLYDEVKAAQVLRSSFDHKCRLLRQQESRGEQTDKTRAVVKDLHTRIKVAIHRIDSISKKIEDIRDKELQPQLEELIEGLRKMWEMMLEYHNLQLHAISVSQSPGGIKITVQTDSRRQVTVQLEHDLSSLSSTFTKWITAQKLYVEAINKWLFKCVTLPQTTSKRNRRAKLPEIRYSGPPIYMLCGSWLEMIDALPSKQVVDSIKDLAAEVAHFLPQQEKGQSKTGKHAFNTPGDDVIGAMLDETSVDPIPALDRFQTSLTGFLRQMSNFSDSSLKMFTDLQKAIQESKNNYEQFKSSQAH